MHPTSVCELVVGLPGVGVFGVDNQEDRSVWIHVETSGTRPRCPSCSVAAAAEDRAGLRDRPGWPRRSPSERSPTTSALPAHGRRRHLRLPAALVDRRDRSGLVRASGWTRRSQSVGARSAAPSWSRQNPPSSSTSRLRGSERPERWSDALSVRLRTDVTDRADRRVPDLSGPTRIVIAELEFEVLADWMPQYSTAQENRLHHSIGLIPPGRTRGRIPCDGCLPGREAELATASTGLQLVRRGRAEYR